MPKNTVVKTETYVNINNPYDIVQRTVAEEIVSFPSTFVQCFKPFFSFATNRKHMLPMLTWLTDAMNPNNMLKISRVKIAEKMNIAENSVYRNFNELKEINAIKCRGKIIMVSPAIAVKFCNRERYNNKLVPLWNNFESVEITEDMLKSEDQ